MPKAKAIIGGGYGDEGKGLFTDYFSRETEGTACVVRFNGGAQAGHTVQLPDGRRHIFSHFGSGTYAGLPTYLSSYFVCNPITFMREYDELRHDKVLPKVAVAPTCPVTTPYDMMLNQIVEQARGPNRHGSVGVGFGETLERQDRAPYVLRVRDLKYEDIIRHKLEKIRTEWFPARLAELNVTKLDESWKDHLTDENIFENYLMDCQKFLMRTEQADLSSLKEYDELLFEGAQGLCLDQNYGRFPHVTRSNTGLKNVVALSERLGIEELDAYYLTRSYMTRHGAGPLPHELMRLPYRKIVDLTNRSHPFQGPLRFAWLDVDLFRKAVHRDWKEQTSSVNLRVHLGMSCLDQIDGPAVYVQGGLYQEGSPESLVETTRQSLGALTSFSSFGPTSTTVRKMDN